MKRRRLWPRETDTSGRDNCLRGGGRERHLSRRANMSGNLVALCEAISCVEMAASTEQSMGRDAMFRDAVRKTMELDIDGMTACRSTLSFPLGRS